MMIPRHSRKIAISFSIVLGLMMILILFGLSRMKIMQEKMDIITQQHNVKSGLMMIMRHGIYERQVSLRNIMLMDDPFERDQGKTNFNSHAIYVVQARNDFAKMPLNKQEREVLDKINIAMVKAYNEQMKLIDSSIYNADKEISNNDLKKAFKTQTEFMNLIIEMISLQKKATEDAVLDAQNSYSYAKSAVFVLGGGALLLGIFVAVFVVRLTESQAQDVYDAMTSLKESRDEMEQRVIERTEQLSVARDQALASNKAKDMFVANMSHELRTPINVIVGYSEMLEEVAEEEKIENIIPDLKKIQAAAKHQLDLINSILDISKMEEGKLEIHPIEFDVEKLVSEVEASIKPLMAKNKNTYKVYCMYGIGMMFSDNMRIRQILLNLISNAAKFTEKGLITLNINKDTNNNEIMFEVKDTGVGIPDVYIKDLFEKFTQEDNSTTRKYGGTGLGLSISKQLSHLLNGDITVESEKGKGSTFTLKLPVVYTA